MSVAQARKNFWNVTVLLTIAVFLLHKCVLKFSNKHNFAIKLFPLNDNSSDQSFRNMATDVRNSLIYSRYIQIFAAALALIIANQRRRLRLIQGMEPEATIRHDTDNFWKAVWCRVTSCGAQVIFGARFTWLI